MTEEKVERKKGQRRSIAEIPPHELEIRFMNLIRSKLMLLPPETRVRMVNWLRQAAFDDARGPAKVHTPDPRQIDNNLDGQARNYQQPLPNGEDPFS